MTTSGVAGLSSHIVVNVVTSTGGQVIDCKADTSPVIYLFLGTNSGLTTSLDFSNLPNTARGILKIQNNSGAVRNIGISSGSGTVTPNLSGIPHNGIRVVEFLVINGLFSWQLWS